MLGMAVPKIRETRYMPQDKRSQHALCVTPPYISFNMGLHYQNLCEKVKLITSVPFPCYYAHVVSLDHKQQKGGFHAHARVCIS